MAEIIPTILSGGFGSRLWPLSRRERPKQFLPIFQGESLFQKTVSRTSGSQFTSPLIISNQDHRFLVGEQLAQMEVEPLAVVLEPVGRNTAAPAALASIFALEKNEDALILLLPSDHLIGDEAAFNAAIAEGVSAAKSGQIVTFGIRPSEPHTGYGYIKIKDASGKGAVPVEAFVEKPSLEKAERFLEVGGYLWNAGIFLFSAQTMKEAFKQHAPEIWSGVEAAYKAAKQDLDFLRLDEELFKQVPSDSIDYAIMEKEKQVACVPMEPKWSDLGSWTAIWENMEKDASGNTALAETGFIDSRNCLVYSDDAYVAVLGLDDVMVVNTKDALLVASKSHAQDVKKVVETLDAQKRSETVKHRRVYRPWGWTEQIAKGDRFQVQSIAIKPDRGMSIQRHIHRAEHWIVVSGTLKVIIDGVSKLVTENQSVFVPLGATHQLFNPGKIEVRMIEVQSGAYIADDDIEREGMNN
ncbi:mannose-1-phosphate guanylyltransferase/mannose-6-phosphate isomerase [Rhodobacteraceae bacterium RKSG542]|nr:mannose-1-phosphate guanylyltransferase/mannose-6-phosphate isomerase [Pseudovibrio flavus]